MFKIPKRRENALTGQLGRNLQSWELKFLNIIWTQLGRYVKHHISWMPRLHMKSNIGIVGVNYCLKDAKYFKL